MQIGKKYTLLLDAQTDDILAGCTIVGADVLPILPTSSKPDTALDPWTLTGYRTVAHLYPTQKNIYISGQGDTHRLLNGTLFFFG